MESVSYALVLSGKYKQADKIMNQNLDTIDKEMKGDFPAAYLE